MGDLPDYTRYIAFDVTIPDVQIGPVIARPMGGILESGSKASAAAFATIAEHVVTEGKTFELAKIMVNCDEDIVFRLVWDAEVIGAVVYVPAKVPFTDWFPWNYKEMVGDGSKKFLIQAKYPSGGSTGTCAAEIVGEEI